MGDQHSNTINKEQVEQIVTQLTGAFTGFSYVYDDYMDSALQINRAYVPGTGDADTGLDVLKVIYESGESIEGLTGPECNMCVDTRVAENGLAYTPRLTEYMARDLTENGVISFVVDSDYIKHTDIKDSKAISVLDFSKREGDQKGFLVGIDIRELSGDELSELATKLGEYAQAGLAHAHKGAEREYKNTVQHLQELAKQTADATEQLGGEKPSMWTAATRTSKIEPAAGVVRNR